MPTNTLGAKFVTMFGGRVFVFNDHKEKFGAFEVL